MNLSKEDEIKVPGDSSRCAICLKLDSKYTCPKCGIAYCSLTCYKSEKHLECTEQFYKNCVLEELRSTDADSSECKKIMDILKRVHENEQYPEGLDSDDDSIPDLSERLEGIDLNDADKVWKCLTDEEKNQFERFIFSGDISELVPEYVPWWTKCSEKKIEEYDEFVSRRKQYISECPNIVKSAIDSSFVKSKASPSVLWNIINVLASYVYTVRFYLGEHLNYPSDCSCILLSLSSNLSKNENFFSKSLAIESVSQNILNNSAIVGSENIEKMKEDVDCLLNGPDSSDKNYYILSALSDVHLLFKRTLKSKECNQKSSGEFSKKFPAIPSNKSVDRKVIHRNIKKIEYYLAWAE